MHTYKLIQNTEVLKVKYLNSTLNDRYILKETGNNKAKAANI